MGKNEIISLGLLAKKEQEIFCYMLCSFSLFSLMMSWNEVKNIKS